MHLSRCRFWPFTHYSSGPSTSTHNCTNTRLSWKYIHTEIVLIMLMMVFINPCLSRTSNAMINWSSCGAGCPGRLSQVQFPNTSITEVRCTVSRCYTTSSFPPCRSIVLLLVRIKRVDPADEYLWVHSWKLSLLRDLRHTIVPWCAALM